MIVLPGCLSARLPDCPAGFTDDKRLLIAMRTFHAPDNDNWLSDSWLCRVQGCQIYHGAIYQNGKLYTK
jgi:hypothetical protein